MFVSKKVLSALIVAGALAAPVFTTTQAQAQVLVVPVANSVPTLPIVVGAGIVSVMIDAAITHQTQCRELTSQEAITSLLLPGIGIAVNKVNINNRCTPNRDTCKAQITERPQTRAHRRAVRACNRLPVVAGAVVVAKY